MLDNKGNKLNELESPTQTKKRELSDVRSSKMLEGRNLKWFCFTIMKNKGKKREDGKTGKE